MKKNYQRIGLLISPLAASVLLLSCVDPGYSSGGFYTSSGVRHGVYSTLPSSFVGNAYYHDGRYYSGGNYQTGRYNYDGRQYSNRYHYNGRYIYGGKYQKYGVSSNRSNDRDLSRRTRDYDSDRRTRDYDSDRRSRNYESDGRFNGRTIYTRSPHRRTIYTRSPHRR